MDATALLSALILFGAVSYFLGVQRARRCVRGGGGISSLHSLPRYYGSMVSLWCLIPALLLLLLWQFSERSVLHGMLLEQIPAHMLPDSPVQQRLLINTLENIASGSMQADNADQSAAAQFLNDSRDNSRTLRGILCCPWPYLAPFLPGCKSMHASALAIMSKA